MGYALLTTLSDMPHILTIMANADRISRKFNKADDMTLVLNTPVSDIEIC